MVAPGAANRPGPCRYLPIRPVRSLSRSFDSPCLQGRHTPPTCQFQSCRGPDEAHRRTFPQSDRPRSHTGSVPLCPGRAVKWLHRSGRPTEIIAGTKQADERATAKFFQILFSRRLSGTAGEVHESIRSGRTRTTLGCPASECRDRQIVRGPSVEGEDYDVVAAVARSGLRRKSVTPRPINPTAPTTIMARA